MSQSKKNITESDLFSAHLGNKARQIISQVLEHNEKLQQENQRLRDEVQKIKDNNVVSEETKKNRFYTKLLTKRFFKLSPKFIHWFKLLSKFISVQLVVQALSFASGIIIIRTLSKEEYAYFTIANSFQSTINVLADMGLSSTIMSIGGKIWQDKILFNQLLHNGMRLRYYMGISAIIIVVPVMGYLLISNGASIEYTALIIIAILIELNYYFSQQIFFVIPLLKSRIDQIQKLDITFSSSRLLLISISNMFSVNAFMYAFCSTLASGLKTFLLKRWNSDTYYKDKVVNSIYKTEMVSTIKSQIPYTIFWCIQGQVTILLISIFGNTTSIADIGALGRFAMIFAPLSAVVSNIFIPSIARCQSLKVLKEKYFKAMLFYVVISAVSIAISFYFPQIFLWILGSNYASLRQELFLIVINTMISLLIGLNWGINHSRGWIQDSWLMIPITIIVQIVALCFVNISNTEGVLLFGIISSLPTLLVNFYLICKGFNSFERLKKGVI